MQEAAFKWLPRHLRATGPAPDGQFVSAMVAYCFVALCLAASSSARRVRTMSGIEDNIETCCSFVHGRSPASVATKSYPDAQSSETKLPQAGLFDRESHRVAAAAFEAKKVDQSPVDVAASSPRGRILPSLVPEESLRRTLRDSALTTAESEPPSRAPKRRDQASKSPRNSGFSSAESAPLAERLSTASRQTSSVQSDEGAGVSPRVATTEPSQAVGDSGGLALSTRARRRGEIAISCDDVGAKPLPSDQQSAIETDSPATHPSRADDRSPQSRKRTILARYVFGNELKLKPGERWKRRLLTMR